MISPRILALFFPFLLVAAGCAGNRPAERYTKLRVTDVRGNLVADWTARGRVMKTDSGYQINAIERLTAPPYARSIRYPKGWRIHIAGPHIERWRCGEPLWLYDLGG